jgi:hypothetical protein
MIHSTISVLPVSTVIAPTGSSSAPAFTQEQLLYLHRVFPEATKGSIEDILYTQGSRAVIKHIANCINKQGG